MNLPVLYPKTPPPPCEKCTAVCCKKSFGHEFAALLSPDEHVRFPEAIDVAPDGGKALTHKALPYVAGKCVHLGDDDRCKVYEQRPAVCREFQCLFSYHLRRPGHGFFLTDNPEVAAIIEEAYPEWTAFRRGEHNG